MKRSLSPLALGVTLSLLCIAAAPAARAAENASFGEATEKLERYTFTLRFYDAWGRPKPHENELPKAQPRAEKKAIEQAKKNFEEHCRNSLNGEPSRVYAHPAAAPGESSACRVSWDEEEGEGSVTCTAKARGVCKVREPEADSRVTTRIASPVREVIYGDQRYLIDEQGVAHPIAGSARD